MMDALLWLFGAAFIAGSAMVLLCQQGQRNIILARFRISRRRYSGSTTPPRSLSLSEKQVDIPVTYSDTFPPSRHSVWSGTGVDSVDPETDVLPLEASYLDAKDSLYTPCGFSIKDIKSLGDFPDYAALSGVRLPQSHPVFDIKNALPRPYRPFRWAYHQTMSLTKMEPDWWLELENTYEERIKQRQALFAQHGEAVLQFLPGSELACKELMEMVLQFLCARYPQYFKLDNDNTIFHNGILHTTTILKNIHPLHVLLNNVPEDFAIMLRDDKTGLYVFRAGVICSALGWNVGTKIGLRLDEIHGPVPDYKEKMKFSMDRFFAKMPSDKPIQRGSWGIEVGELLYMGPDDTAHKSQREHQSPDLSLSQCHLRVDWQTLRRLPLSGAVVFNFKALFTPVEQFRDEPYVPGLLLKVLNEGKGNIMAYKNTWHTDHVVKPALERFHDEQVRSGLVPGGWEPQTLDESPWFPGWEGKWRRQQGF
ncbi:hypothetical protein P153DRAFT_378231 [Dothidotthia symphoricarpi CBS 119687]|uniref:HRQ family protein n=1 Tax=Dothidotthia symphoricarpi CBS 119687 TaxID=1392245 RepID=A0A6A6A359_9PLEO|nr:uncharacterized protein P153DRAFT_378231 [Dothidotthia symphoricarpi CBS 119687]KAF2125986.1 hypothetical protein P153DRAFT_378231 [Dothidotthia symphoricarpi CBS 119687]